MKGGKKQMDKSVQITLIVVIGAISLVLLAMAGISSVLPTNTVTGNGMSEIKVTPDLVGIYFSVETSGDTSSEASDANSEIVDALVTKLLVQGFDRDEIQTTGFSVYPDYDWVDGQRVDKGYKAVHSIRVEMSSQETGKIGSVVDAGIDAGAGISYISFELSQGKQNEYKAQALKLASEDAKIKAESVAEGLGKRLGRLVSVTTSDFNYYPWAIYEADGAVTSSAEAKAATTNIQPGEQSITASVTAVFKLL